MLLLVLLLLLPTLFAVGDGVRARIVGGADARIEDLPYQASLQVGGRHECGAILVGLDVALTAAHCLEDVDPRNVTLRVGTDQLEEGGEVLAVTAITKHPLYDYVTLDYDVAVVALRDSVTPGPTVRPVGLVAEDYYPLPDTPGTVSGWGTLQYGDIELSKQLQAVTMPVVRSSVCNDGYLGSITESMLCVGETWKGACSGDAGGPATIVGDDATTQLLGVVSWNYGCDLVGNPTVVASVAYVRAWIRDVAGV